MNKTFSLLLSLGCLRETPSLVRSMLSFVLVSTSSISQSDMAERKGCGVRPAIGEERGCKPLLRFQGRSVDFLAAECLIEEDSRGGVISERWKYFCDLLAIRDSSL